ncbi:MAG: sodium-independent anion transporter [Chromatiaceae bacterium]
MKLTAPRRASGEMELLLWHGCIFMARRTICSTALTAFGSRSRYKPQPLRHRQDPLTDGLCRSGSLIFGAASALNRQQNRLADVDTLIVDLTQAPHLGVISSMALKSAIRETARHGGEVFLAGLRDQPRTRFERLGIIQVVHPERWAGSRIEVLEAIAGLAANSGRGEAVASAWPIGEHGYGLR